MRKIFRNKDLARPNSQSGNSLRNLSQFHAANLYHKIISVREVASQACRSAVPGKDEKLGSVRFPVARLKAYSQENHYRGLADVLTAGLRALSDITTAAWCFLASALGQQRLVAGEPSYGVILNTDPKVVLSSPAVVP
jgi:hypothetical protein